MGITSKVEGLSGGWIFLLSIAAFFVWVYTSDWIESQVVAFTDWLVSIGGYGLSNAVFGAVAAGVCGYFLHRARRGHRKMELEGDPEPLKPPFEYEVPAKAFLWLGWIAGVLCWTYGVISAIFGFYEVVVIGPILGTAAIAGGHMSLAHARAMDARRGRPPAVTGHG